MKIDIVKDSFGNFAGYINGKRFTTAKPSGHLRTVFEKELSQTEIRNLKQLLNQDEASDDRVLMGFFFI
jgi:hypothetical protein